MVQTVGFIDQALSDENMRESSRQPRPPQSKTLLSYVWFLDELEPGGHVYNIADSIRIKGDLDTDKLRMAIEAVI
ncbi:hypothetical protein [Paenibacillus glacialis]|uniref:Condensation domain-containing protein n=1 Tax=Paenibacillus glacialis TaxID=494026 RepID=A0A168K6M6_9BACL|nr:hypothetical protein [Paenibacillus glacialis]OAB41621.1 hypothetical protein PGLA_15170 [Paenibacillus glacialis]